MNGIDYHLLDVPDGAIDLDNHSHVNSAIASAYDQLKHCLKYAPAQSDLRTSVAANALSDYIGKLIALTGLDENTWLERYGEWQMRTQDKGAT